MFDSIFGPGLIRRMFDIIRLVDPRGKQAVVYGEDRKVEERTDCFDIWGHSRRCENCISARALEENRMVSKLEYLDDKIYLIMAVPIDAEGGNWVAEMISDTTDSLALDCMLKDSDSHMEAHAFIEAMNQRAITDSLTKLFNRRYIDETLPAEIMREQVSDRPLSLLMIDMDRFKAINDTWGHLAGDLILQSVADILRTTLRRKTDWAARYGGDEFLLCLPGADAGYASRVGETIEDRVHGMQVAWDDTELRATVSIGIIEVLADSIKDSHEALQLVDRLMYRAKTSGGDRIEVRESTPVGSSPSMLPIPYPGTAYKLT